MNKEILISIVIATKNRQKYALSAVNSILALNDIRLEVVVQDNSDNDSLSSMLNAHKSDARLVYRHTTQNFSFIDNFNASIDIANGEYLCLIGDDDGINPELIDVAQWAKNNRVEAVVGSISANYRWAGTGAPDTFFTKMTDSTLTITHFSGNAKFVNIEKSLSALMANGATNYLQFPLPKLYHGIISRKSLEKVKVKTEQYINGLSPDIYSSISLACTIDNLVSIDYPLTIPGVCAESGSIKEGQLKKHSKRLEDAPHFNSRLNYSWSKEVPRIYCVQTIWADSCLAALRDMGRYDLIEKVDKYMLYANILDADSSLEVFIKQHIPTLLDKILLRKAYFKGPFKNLIFNRAWGRTKKVFKLEKFENILKIANIEQATKALQDYLKPLEINIQERLMQLKR